MHDAHNRHVACEMLPVDSSFRAQQPLCGTKFVNQFMEMVDFHHQKIETWKHLHIFGPNKSIIQKQMVKTKPQ